MRKICVTKLEAAATQLSVAIAMFFSEDDPISSYALSCNSGEILRKLRNHQKKDYFLSVVEDHFDRKSDLYKTYNSTWNFLKHADKDPDSKIEFSEEQLVYSLWVATHDLYQIVDNLARFPAALTYYHWYIQSCPEFAPEKCELPEANALFRRADRDSGGIRYKDDKAKRAYGLEMLNRAASGLRILPQSWPENTCATT